MNLQNRTIPSQSQNITEILSEQHQESETGESLNNQFSNTMSTHNISTDRKYVQRQLAKQVLNFLGKIDSTTTLKFISKVNKYLRRCDATDIDKLDLVTSKFAGAAIRWLDDYERTNPEGSPAELKTWPQIEILMRKRFIPAANESQTILKLSMLKQGKMDVNELADKCLQLFANVISLSDREKKFYFFNALHTELKKDLPNFYDSSTTYDDMVTRASLLEAAAKTTTLSVSNQQQQFHPAIAAVAQSESQIKKKKIDRKPEIKQRKDKQELICQICKKYHFNNQCPIVKDFIKSKISEFSANVAETHNTQNKHDVLALLDSGCSQHMCPRESSMTNIRKTNIDITIADGSKIQAEKIGDIFRKIGGKIIRIRNVLFVPKLTNLLISIKALCDDKYEVKFERSGHYRVAKENVAIVGKSHGKTYTILAAIDNSEIAFLSIAEVAELWHEWLGHPVQTKTAKLAKMYPELAKITPVLDCRNCKIAKPSGARFKPSKSRSQNPLDLVHIDLVGPVQTENKYGIRYAHTIVDDYSRHISIALLQTKLAATVAEAFHQEIRKLDVLTGKSLMKVRGDNGTEFSQIITLLINKGIAHQTSAKYTPEQNGRVECVQLSQWERLRTIISSSCLPINLWPELLLTSTHIQNRIPQKAIGNETPIGCLRGHSPSSVSYMRAIGALVFSLDQSNNYGKLLPRACTAYLIGYGQGSKTYRLWDPQNNEIFESASVTFDELRRYAISSTSSPFLEIEGVINTPVSFPNSIFNLRNNENQEDKKIKAKKVGKGTSYLIKWANPELEDEWLRGAEVRNTDVYTRWQEQVEKHIENCEFENEFAAAASCNIPTNPQALAEALSSTEQNEWRKALASEIQSQEENNTWTPVPRAAANTSIDTKTIFRIKLDGTGIIARYKACIVARGFEQRPGDYFETYAPVLSKEGVHILLAYTAENNHLIHQVDIKTAFLYAELQNDIYLEFPDGYNPQGYSRDKYVLKLNKSIYGLKQSPMLWNGVIHTYLTEILKFNQLPEEKCIYLRKVENDTEVISIYVDDILISSKSENNINIIKTKLAKRFQTSDLGIARHILGMEIDQSRNEIHYNQQTYIEQLIHKYQVSNIHTRKCPASENEKLTSEIENTTVDTSKYQSMVGSLQYIALCTCTDITAAVNHASRFNSAPRINHEKFVLRIFAYLASTKHLGLTFSKRNLPKYTVNIRFYVDSDWAGDQSDFRSTSGFVATINNTAVAWRAGKQTCTAHSSVEAEAISLSDSVNDIIWLAKIVNSIFNTKLIPEVHCDSAGAVKIANSGSVSGKTKHIGVHIKTVNELIDNKQIIVSKISGADNPADLFTKNLGLVTFEPFRNMISIFEAAQGGMLNIV